MDEMEIMKMMETAAALSQLMNPGGESFGEKDMKKMASVMEAMKLMQAMFPAPAPTPPEKKIRPEPEPHFYDDPIHTPALKTVKAAIPYLDYRYQKPLGILTKLLEIQKLLEMYNSRVMTMQQQGTANWRVEMLRAIRPHVPPEKQSSLDLLIKCIELKEITDKIAVVSKN